MKKQTRRIPILKTTEGLWRCTVDDDPEKQWDSTTALDALIDAEQAIADGALKVLIERIEPPK